MGCAGMSSGLLQRLGLSLVTLWLLSMIVFSSAYLLPGDVARSILGPMANPQSVAVLNGQLGLDKPLVSQYVGWLTNAFSGNLGDSLRYRQPVAPMIGDALWNSVKLGGVAFLIVIPISMVGGVLSGLSSGKLPDKVITNIGLVTMVLPEFVSSIILILLFGIWFPIFPITAQAPNDAGALRQVYYLILPSIPLVLILFGYIARMARAGVIDAYRADYTRTAVLKGLPSSVVVIKHVLRNALIPTVAVIATQAGYVIGGLVVVETLFHYRGIGSLIFDAAKAKDFPMLVGGVVAVGAVYTICTVVGDMLLLMLDPRLRRRA
jgi:peptide/nickel transport system permease protein